MVPDSLSPSVQAWPSFTSYLCFNNMISISEPTTQHQCQCLGNNLHMLVPSFSRPPPYLLPFNIANLIPVFIIHLLFFLFGSISTIHTPNKHFFKLLIFNFMKKHYTVYNFCIYYFLPKIILLKGKRVTS